MGIIALGLIGISLVSRFDEKSGNKMMQLGKNETQIAK